MVLIQATIYPILPIDAEVGGIIRFSWKGNQAFKNRCIIKKNETDEVVYDKTIETFKYEHPIDLIDATLENGVEYLAYITVFDKDGNESDLQSIGEKFWCLSTPEFRFDGVNNETVISSSSYEFSLIYSQTEGELLDSWSMTLYNTSHDPLSSTGIIYQTTDLSHVFSGFSNRNQYAIRAIGKTVNGINLDTGYITISVTYKIKDVFSLLEPTNVREQGAIQLRSNIVSAEGHTSKEPIFINGCVDLTHDVLTYNKGFLFMDDYSYVMSFSGMKPNQEIFVGRFDDKKGDVWFLDGTYKLDGVKFLNSMNEIFKISIVYRVGNFGSLERRSCFEMTVYYKGLTQVYYSNILPLLASDDKVGLLVTRENGLYTIEITNLGKVVAA